jgi:hypothetical protein
MEHPSHRDQRSPEKVLNGTSLAMGYPQVEDP